MTEHSDQRLKLAVVVGSTREGRVGPTVAQWFAGHAGQVADVDLIDLLEVTPGEQFGARIGAADAVVVVTPEYNHSFPGPLKVAIDSLKPEWVAKPIGFVSYGGISGGLRAVEALRVVFAELHAVTVRETVSFAMVWSQFGPDGQPVDTTAPAAAADRLMAQVSWWASAVRGAGPYPG